MAYRTFVEPDAPISLGPTKLPIVLVCHKSLFFLAYRLSFLRFLDLSEIFHELVFDVEFHVRLHLVINSLHLLIDFEDHLSA